MSILSAKTYKSFRNGFSLPYIPLTNQLFTIQSLDGLRFAGSIFCLELPQYGKFNSRTLVVPNTNCQTAWVDRGRLLKLTLSAVRLLKGLRRNGIKC